MTKFNFLNRRIATNKAAAELRQRFPRRSVVWINAKARQVSGPDDIIAELRAPQCASTSQRGQE